MADARDRFDVVIDTNSAPHDLGPITVETIDLLVGRKRLSSAGSGGRPATAAMLDFCGEHGAPRRE